MEPDALFRERTSRQGKARAAALWGVSYQGITAGCQFISLGLLARHTTREEYGLVMTVLAMTTWIPMAFLGQNSVLMTRLAAVAHSDRKAASRVFSSSLLLVGLSSGSLLLALVTLGPFLDWSRILNTIGEPAGLMAGPLTIAALSVSIISLPSLLGGFSVFSYQRGDLVHKSMSAGNAISVAAVTTAIVIKAPIWVAAALTLTGPLAGGLALWGLGLTKGLIPRPRLEHSCPGVLREMASAGGLFFLIDAATVILLRSPEVISAQLHGTGAVGPLASVGRLLVVLLAIYQAVLMPFWPALGEAFHQGDVEWVKRIARRTGIWVIVIWMGGVLGLVVFGAIFVRLFTGSQDYSTPGLIAVACAQSLGQGLWTWLSVLMGALSLQRQQVKAAAIAALSYLPLALFAGTHAGPAGVAAAQAAALILCGFPAGLFLLTRHLSGRSPGE